ncbi:MAG: DUF11 domain-containing protein, partial [Anaerolineae bacterium]|nr:DUF11 domain-containing protein [Anaerolineae bacterium]
TGIITVTDTLPPGMTFSSASGGGFTCSAAAQVVTCTSPGPITVGSTATITLNVNPGTVGSGTNIATVSTPGDPNSGNNTSNDITNISGIPDLTVTKTHAGNFFVGQPDAQYTITVNNVGSGASTGTITVQDTLPAGLTFNAVTSGPFTCAPPNSVNPTCTSVSSIPAGGSLSFTIRVNVTAAGAGTNQVAVSGGGETNAANNNASDLTTIDAAASIDLQVVSKTGPASFTVGTNGTYTITVKNIGNAASTGTITVADTLPAGMTLVSSSGGIFTCTGTGTANVSCTSPGPLAANQTATITLTVLPDNTTAASVTNTATVSGGGDTNAANNQASTPAIPVVGAPNLQISKLHTSNFFAGQTNAAYTLTVTNVGNGPTTGARPITDNLPLGMTLSTYTTVSGGSWTCFGSTTVTCTNPGPINAFGTSAVRIFVNTPVAGGPVTNTATVSTPGEGNTGDNSGPDLLPTIITTQPDLGGASISISANPSTNVNADNSTTSTITVNVNKGGLPMGGVPVTLNVSPSGATISGQVNTDNNGNATFTIKSGTATLYTITPQFPTAINVPSLPTTTVQFVVASPTATPNAAQATSTAAAAVAAGSSNPQGSAAAVDCTTVPADNVFKANITVTLRNSSGGAVSGKNVSITSSPALTGLLITPTQGVSDTNGQVKFTVQSPTQGGPITFTATNTSDNITIGTVQVTFGRPGTQAVCPAPTQGAGGLPVTTLNLLNVPLDGPGIGQVIPYRLRVRTGPGLQFPQIGTLQGKQLVTLLGRDSRGRWFLIRLQNGGVGWVSAFYIRVRRLAFRHLPIVDANILILPTASTPGVPPTATPPR